MIFELRQYRIFPGKRDEWVKIMEEKIIPGQTAMGAVIIGSFVGIEEDDLYVWIRRFENEDEKIRLYELVYQSDHWKNFLDPRVREMMDRDKMKVTRIEATPHSVIH